MKKNNFKMGNFYKGLFCGLAGYGVARFIGIRLGVDMQIMLGFSLFCTFLIWYLIDYIVLPYLKKKFND